MGKKKEEARNNRPERKEAEEPGHIFCQKNRFLESWAAEISQNWGDI